MKKLAAQESAPGQTLSFYAPLTPPPFTPTEERSSEMKEE